MRKIRTTIATLLLAALANTNIVAAEANGTENTNESEAQNTVTVSSPRFARPLIQRWITEYEKANPQKHIVLAKGNADSDVRLVLTGEGTEGTAVVFFGQYAILPVTTSGSEADKLLAKKEWNKKSLKRLFFQQDELDALENGQQKTIDVNVYAANGKTSVSEAYAKHFGLSVADYRGKRISGDEAFLNTAIGKDTKGVTINALPNIFDLDSRHVKSGLSIVALDVKSDYAAALGNGALLDQTLKLLEEKDIDEVPVDKIGFAYDSLNPAALAFISWVLHNGTAYNHQYGLLNLSPKDLAQQTHSVENATLTAQK